MRGIHDAGTLHACFESAPGASETNFYAEGLVAGVAATGKRKCILNIETRFLEFGDASTIGGPKIRSVHLSWVNFGHGNCSFHYYFRCKGRLDDLCGLLHNQLCRMRQYEWP